MTNTEIDSILGSFPTIADSEQHMAEALRSNYRLRRTRKDRNTYKYSNGFFSLLLHDNGDVTAYAKNATGTTVYGYKRVALCFGHSITVEALTRLLDAYGRCGIRNLPAEQIIGTEWSRLD